MKKKVLEIKHLDYKFTSKPLLIGGKAMEYYNLRKGGRDVDFVITEKDYQGLAKKYPQHLKEVWGDRGVIVGKLEYWTSIRLYDYDFLAERAQEEKNYLVVSLEKLLLLKTLFIFDKPQYKKKNEKDIELLVRKIHDEKYKNWKTISKKSNKK